MRKSIRVFLATVALSVLAISVPASAFAVADAPAEVTSTAVASASTAGAVAGQGLGLGPNAGVAQNFLVPDDSAEFAEWPRYLPSNRWSTASQTFHGRYDQFLQNDVITWSQRNISQQQGMSIGNTAYTATQGLLLFGLEMEPLNLLGEEADKVAATIGVSLWQNSPVVVAIIVLIIGSVVFQMMRTGARPWRRIATAAGIVALFAMMTTGAQASTTSGSGEFEPGLFSPGWFATSISETVTLIATVPAQALSVESPLSAVSAPQGAGCRPYLDYMDERVSEGGASASIPGLVSDLWESSGLTVWKQVQYGTIPYNTTTGLTYGDHVFCHQLDWQADIPANLQASTMFGGRLARDAAGYSSGSPAWGASDNNQRDRSLVAWAACEVSQNGAISVRPGFQREKGGAEWISPTECANWWNATDENVNLDAFNVGGKASDVTDLTDNRAVANFLLTLHGNDPGPGLVLTWAYGLTSLLMFFVFGSFGIGIALAKFAGVVMIVTIFFVMLMSLLARENMGSKLTGYLKTYLGFTVFAFGATFVLAILTTLSRMVSSMGVGVFGGGEFMSLLLTGLSPVIAAWLLHLMFTKLFKLPSVFKPSSALAWGSAFGSVGAVMGSGLTQRLESRTGSYARGAVQGAQSRTKNYALGKIAGVKGSGAGRAGAMSPTMARVLGAGRGVGLPGGAGAAGVAGNAMAATAASAAAAGRSTVGAGIAGAGIASAAKVAVGAGIAGAAFGFMSSRMASRKRGAVSPQAAADLGQAAPLPATSRVSAAVAKARTTAAYVKSGRMRSDLGTRASQMADVARTRMVESNRRTQALGTWFRQDPVGVAGYAAAGAAVKIRAAASTTLKVAAATTKVVGDPRVASVGRDAARMGVGALIGTIAAGPVGTVVGAGIGAGRVRAAHTRAGRAAAQQPVLPAAAKPVQSAEKAAAAKPPTPGRRARQEPPKQA